jgi:hypothetical protein
MRVKFSILSAAFLIASAATAGVVYNPFTGKPDYTGAPSGGGGITGNACTSGQYASEISSSGALTCSTIPNSSTTAVSTNTANKIVTRDASGNFAAGTITATVSGNASTSTALAANPTDCSSNQYATTIAANGDLTCASITNASTTATSANTNSAIVARDGSGNFSAGTITATLTGNATNVSGTVAVGNGGTGLTSGTSGGVPYYSASNAIASSGALTANQLIIGGGSGGAPSTLTAGSAGDHIVNNVSGVPTVVEGYDKRNKIEWIDDFTGGGAAGSGYLNLASSSGTGSSANFNQSIDSSHLGLVRMQVGTTTTGSAYHISDVFDIFGGGVHALEWLVYLPAVSDGTDTWFSWQGFGNGTTGQPTNGCYFYYPSHAANSGNWQLLCSKASSHTTTNTSTAPTFSGWQRLRIEVDAGATVATFYVNGSSVGTVTTNIPNTVSTNKFGVQFTMLKSAGTNDRIAYLDYVWYRTLLTTTR